VECEWSRLELILMLCPSYYCSYSLFNKIREQGRTVSAWKWWGGGESRREKWPKHCMYIWINEKKIKLFLVCVVNLYVCVCAYAWVQTWGILWSWGFQHCVTHSHSSWWQSFAEYSLPFPGFELTNVKKNKPKVIRLFKQ
jgi:hypothetical protein